MNKKEMLLVKLNEECLEVAHRVSKALRFSMEEIQPGQSLNNKERIGEELKDLSAIIAYMIREEIFTMEDVNLFNPEDIELRRTRIEHYLDHSRKVGTLVD